MASLLCWTRRRWRRGKRSWDDLLVRPPEALAQLEAEQQAGPGSGDGVEITGEAVAGPDLMRRFYASSPSTRSASGATPAASPRKSSPTSTLSSTPR